MDAVRKQKSNNIFIQKRDEKVLELCATGPHDLLDIAVDCFGLEVNKDNAIKKQQGYSKVKNRLLKLAQDGYVFIEKSPVRNFNFRKNFYRLAPKGRDYLENQCGYRYGEARLCPKSGSNLKHDLLVRDVWKHVRKYVKEHEGKNIVDYEMLDNISQKKIYPGLRKVPDMEVCINMKSINGERHPYTLHIDVCRNNQLPASVYTKVSNFKHCNSLFLIMQDRWMLERLISYYEMYKELFNARVLFATASDFFNKPFGKNDNKVWTNPNRERGSIFMIPRRKSIIGRIAF